MDGHSVCHLKDSGVAEGSDDVALHLDEFTGTDRKLARLEVLCLISRRQCEKVTRL